MYVYNHYVLYMFPGRSVLLRFLAALVSMPWMLVSCAHFEVCWFMERGFTLCRAWLVGTRLLFTTLCGTCATTTVVVPGCAQIARYLLREVSTPEGRCRPADVLLCSSSFMPVRLPDGSRQSSRKVSLDCAVINTNMHCSRCIITAHREHRLDSCCACKPPSSCVCLASFAAAIQRMHSSGHDLHATVL